MPNKVNNSIKKHLFIAPFPPVEGGVTLLSEDLVEYLKGLDALSVDIIDINFKRPLFIRCLKFIKAIILIPIKIAQSDNVSMHLTARAVIWIGFYISVICKILNKPLVFRKFAGSFDLAVDRRGSIYKHVVSFIMRNCVCLLETKYLVNEFKKRFPESEIHEFANHRRFGNLCMEKKLTNRDKIRFVFAGEIKKSKGIMEIIDSVGMLNKNGYRGKFEFDVYGNPETKSIEKMLRDQEGLKYRGYIANSELMKMLPGYDALVLPSYGEGISGVIIEAMACGLIPIVTNWRSVREPVPEKVDLKAEIKDSQSLFLALEKFVNNVEYYRAYSDEMKAASRYYSTEKWGNEFKEIIMSL